MTNPTPTATGIRCFKASERHFEPYIGDPADPLRGEARIARLVGPEISRSMGGGIVIYGRQTASWALPFDEFVVILKGAMRVVSGGVTYQGEVGDVLWFPAHTPLTYEIDDEVTVFYAKHPVDATLG
ncbi:cupin domain-containing protein [Zavarzinia sp. CC-PAN008]|uniref:cupin domain-containing protein n=1 Tax=Zavarzinia sp. CC-PAN008 TaxID=3243332 RepID=UPI003F742C2C